MAVFDIVVTRVNLQKEVIRLNLFHRDAFFSVFGPNLPSEVLGFPEDLHPWLCLDSSKTRRLAKKTAPFPKNRLMKTVPRWATIAMGPSRYQRQQHDSSI